MVEQRFPSAEGDLELDIGRDLPLTLREIEVAVFAGACSNADIGETLKISRRTVENHISNGLRKTKTSTRPELFELVTTARNGGVSPRFP